MNPRRAIEKFLAAAGALVVEGEPESERIAAALLYGGQAMLAVAALDESGRGRAEAARVISEIIKAKELPPTEPKEPR